MTDHKLRYLRRLTLAAGFVFAVTASCTKAKPDTVSLLDQIAWNEPAGPWRCLFAGRSEDGRFRDARVVVSSKDASIREVLKDKGSADPVGNRRQHVEVRQDGLERMVSILIPADIEPFERVLTRIHWGERRHREGSIELSLLWHGTVVASVETSGNGTAVEFDIEVPAAHADMLVLRSMVQSREALQPPRSIVVVALQPGSSITEMHRARQFARWISQIIAEDTKERSAYREAIELRRNPVSRDLSTMNSIVLACRDTIEFSVPKEARGRPFQFWFSCLLTPFNDEARLELEAKTDDGTEVLRSWPIRPRHDSGWTRVMLEPEVLPRYCESIRFVLHGFEALVAIGDPIFLSTKGASGGRKNLILIDLDTLRADRLECYGYKKRPTSARMDSMLDARGFFLFEHAYSAAPYTLPATAKFFASRYLDFRPEDYRGGQNKMLASVLRENGYYCAAFTGGGLLRTPGFEQGFHEYYWSADLGKIEDSFPQAIEWLGNWGRGSFFLFLHTYEPHMPLVRDIFCAKLPHRRLGNLSRGNPLLPKGMDLCTELCSEESLYVQAAYDGGVRTATDAVADLFLTLERLDLWRNTVVVILSDHGEEFWDHLGVFGAHKHSLYGELLSVPFMVFDPEDAGGGLKRIETEVSTVDLLPTMVDLLRLNWDGIADGISLSPLLTGRDLSRRLPILAMTEVSNPSRICIITDGHKYIEPLDENRIRSDRPRGCEYYAGRRELYSLSDDPRERSDLFRNKRLLAKEMKKLLDAATKAAIQNNTTDTDGEERDYPENLRKQLKALGYID